MIGPDDLVLAIAILALSIIAAGIAETVMGPSLERYDDE